MTERPTPASLAPGAAAPPPSGGRIGLRAVLAAALLRATVWLAVRGR